MNVRFAKDCLRWRISRQELELILERGELWECNMLPGGLSLEYGVRLQPGHFALQVAKTDTGMRLWLTASREALAELLEKPPAKDLGLYAPGIALEVDLKKDASRSSLVARP